MEINERNEIESWKINGGAEGKLNYNIIKQRIKFFDFLSLDHYELHMNQ